MKPRAVLLSLAALAAACDTKPSTSGPADVEAAARSNDGASQSTEPERTASFDAQLDSIDPADPDAFASATRVFVQTHPEGVDVETTASDLATLIAFVDETAQVLDARVQGDDALLAAACAGVGVECGGPPSDAALETLEGFGAQGVRFDYAGEGTVTAVVDHGVLAEAVGAAITPGVASTLEAIDATMRAWSRYDEGGYNGDPDLMAEALLRWETVAQLDGVPFGPDPLGEVDRVRTAYLRLCDHGEWETPACNAREPLRRSYADFVAEHEDSPSAPAVAALRAALKKMRWKMKAAQLDAAVAAALEAVPAGG